MNQILNLARKPFTLILIPICNSILELWHLLQENIKFVARYLLSAIFLFTIASSLGYYNLAISCITWILLGVASSIGFGFGMHTFVLFLAPHIAAVTMAANSCQSLNFPEPPYPNEIICPDKIGNEQVTFIKIMQKIALEAFMWGLGTAIGELPPYLAARLRSQAIGRKAGGDSLDSDGQAAGWELWVIKIIKKVGFFGILLCAAIPNPLFDAAGVASGIAQIPFMSFFGATLIGKAVIKVSLQSSFVILAFHKNNLDSIISQVDTSLSTTFPSVKQLNLTKSLSRLLREQRNNVLSKNVGNQRQASLMSTLFNWIVCACFALFFASLINALDKQYKERTASKAKRRLE